MVITKINNEGEKNALAKANIQERHQINHYKASMKVKKQKQ